MVMLNRLDPKDKRAIGKSLARHARLESKHKLYEARFELHALRIESMPLDRRVGICLKKLLLQCPKQEFGAADVFRANPELFKSQASQQGITTQLCHFCEIGDLSQSSLDKFRLAEEKIQQLIMAGRRKLSKSIGYSIPDRPNSEDIVAARATQR